MRYALIFRRPFHRTRSMDVEAGYLDVAVAELDPEEVFVEHVIDFDNRTVTPVALTGDRRLIEIADGEYGELTAGEFFVEEGLVKNEIESQTLTDTEVKE